VLGNFAQFKLTGVIMHTFSLFATWILLILAMCVPTFGIVALFIICDNMADARARRRMDAVIAQAHLHHLLNDTDCVVGCPECEYQMEIDANEVCFWCVAPQGECDCDFV
jgi:hypothetical protein